MKQENEYGKVTALKWAVVPDKYFAGFSTSHLFAHHDKDTRIELLHIEKGRVHDHLWSNWIETKIFNKLPYYDWQRGKYNQRLIAAKIREMINSGELKTLQREDVKSSSLQYLH